jgi:hypothetical protein
MLFHAAMRAEAVGSIDFDTDSFKVMLVTSAYTPDKDAHDFRNDVTNEVSGTGYTAGGTATTVTVGTVDTGNDRVDITFGAVSWTTSTITARGAVYYKSRGGASSADEIILYDDFGGDIVSSAGTFSLAASIYRKSNP